jgi:hypothetical protein
VQQIGPLSESGRGPEQLFPEDSGQRPFRWQGGANKAHLVILYQIGRVIGVDSVSKISADLGQVAQQPINILVYTGPAVAVLPGKQVGINSNPPAIIYSL